MSDQALAEALAQAVAPLLGQQERRRPRLASHLDDWMSTIVQRDCAPGTVRQRRAVVASLARHLGRYRVDEVGQREWDGYLAARRDLSLSSQRLHLGTLLTALRWARRWGVLATVPEITMATAARTEPRWLRVEEEARLLAAAEPMLRMALELGAWAGLRKGEILGAQWSDVTYGQAPRLRVKRQVLATSDEGKRVDIGPPKHGRERTVSIGADLADALKAHRHLRGDWVVCYPDGSPWSHGKARHELRLLGESLTGEAAVPDLHWHALRHTYAARWLAAGGSIYQLSRQMGHASVRTTERYAHLGQADLDRAAAAVEGARAAARREGS